MYETNYHRALTVAFVVGSSAAGRRLATGGRGLSAGVGRSAGLSRRLRLGRSGGAARHPMEEGVAGHAVEVPEVEQRREPESGPDESRRAQP